MPFVFGTSVYSFKHVIDLDEFVTVNDVYATCFLKVPTQCSPYAFHGTILVGVSHHYLHFSSFVSA